MKIPGTNYHLYFRNPDRSLPQALRSASPTIRNEIANQEGPRRILPGVYAGDKSLLRGLQIRQKIEADAAAKGLRPLPSSDLPDSSSPIQLLGEMIENHEEDMDSGVLQMISGSDKSELEYSSEEDSNEVSHSTNMKQITRDSSFESTGSIPLLQHPTDGETEITIAVSPERSQRSLQPLTSPTAMVSTIDLVDKISNLTGEGLSDDFKSELSQYLDNLAQAIIDTIGQEEGIDKSHLLSQTDEVLNKINEHRAFSENYLINNNPLIFSAMAMCISHKMIDDFHVDNKLLAQHILYAPNKHLSSVEFNELEVEILKLMGFIDFNKQGTTPTT